MQRNPSQYSATMIGVHEDKHNLGREMFVQEAREVSEYLNGVHHVRKQGHLQVMYPETIHRLSELQAERTQTLRSSQTNFFPSQTAPSSTLSEPKQRVKDFKQTRLKDYEESIKHHMMEERMINYRKKEYFREMGRKAVANQVISGTAPQQKDYLFPRTASHEQILAITGTLKAPNPDVIPPEVPRQRKFKPDQGWS